MAVGFYPRGIGFWTPYCYLIHHVRYVARYLRRGFKSTELLLVGHRSCLASESRRYSGFLFPHFLLVLSTLFDPVLPMTIGTALSPVILSFLHLERSSCGTSAD